MGEALVLIRRGNTSDGPYVVFFPTPSGDFLSYLEVAKSLDPRVTAFGLRYWSGSACLVDVAGYYTSAITDKFAAKDTLLLFGWCYGGILAYETSVQLASIGRSASNTWAIDAVPPTRDARHTEVSELLTKFAEALPSLRRRQAAARAAYRSIDEVYEEMAKEGQRAVQYHQLWGMFGNYRLSHRQLCSHECRNSEIDLTLVTVTNARFSDDGYQRWNELCPGLVRETVEGADHWTIIERPFAGRLADSVNKWVGSHLPPR